MTSTSYDPLSLFEQITIILEAEQREKCARKKDIWLKKYWDWRW
jgi:hypothetical protein